MGKLKSAQLKSRLQTNQPGFRPSGLWWLLVTGGILVLALVALRHGGRPAEETHFGTAPNAPALQPGTMTQNAVQPSAAPDPRPKPLPKEAADQLINEGTTLLKQGDADAAVVKLQQAVKLNPDDEDAHYDLGLALARKGERAAAEREYAEALKIYPDYAEAHNNLGNLLLADGKLEDAITH